MAPVPFFFFFFFCTGHSLLVRLLVVLALTGLLCVVNDRAALVQAAPYEAVSRGKRNGLSGAASRHRASKQQQLQQQLQQQQQEEGGASLRSQAATQLLDFSKGSSGAAATEFDIRHSQVSLDSIVARIKPCRLRRPCLPSAPQKQLQQQQAACRRENWLNFQQCKLADSLPVAKVKSGQVNAKDAAEAAEIWNELARDFARQLSPESFGDALQAAHFAAFLAPERPELWLHLGQLYSNAHLRGDTGVGRRRTANRREPSSSRASALAAFQQIRRTPAPTAALALETSRVLLALASGGPRMTNNASQEELDALAAARRAAELDLCSVPTVLHYWKLAQMVGGEEGAMQMRELFSGNGNRDVGTPCVDSVPSILSGVTKPGSEAKDTSSSPQQAGVGYFGSLTAAVRAAPRWLSTEHPYLASGANAIASAGSETEAPSAVLHELQSLLTKVSPAVDFWSATAKSARQMLNDLRVHLTGKIERRGARHFCVEVLEANPEVKRGMSFTTILSKYREFRYKIGVPENVSLVHASDPEAAAAAAARVAHADLASTDEWMAMLVDFEGHSDDLAGSDSPTEQSPRTPFGPRWDEHQFPMLVAMATLHACSQLSFEQRLPVGEHVQARLHSLPYLAWTLDHAAIEREISEVLGAGDLPAVLMQTDTFGMTALHHAAVQYDAVGFHLILEAATNWAALNPGRTGNAEREHSEGNMPLEVQLLLVENIFGISVAETVAAKCQDLCPNKVAGADAVRWMAWTVMTVLQSVNLTHHSGGSDIALNDFTNGSQTVEVQTCTSAKTGSCELGKFGSPLAGSKNSSFGPPPSGWRTNLDATTSRTLEQIDAAAVVPEVNASDTSLAQLIRNFVAVGRPVVIRNAVKPECQSGMLSRLWAKGSVKNSPLASLPVLLSVLPYAEDGGYTKNMTVGEYIDQYMDGEGAGAFVDDGFTDVPYIFESKRERVAAGSYDAQPRLEPFSTALECIPEDLVTYLNLPPSQMAGSWAQWTIGVGADGAGAPLHIHEYALNLVLVGTKRWFAYPPPYSTYSVVPTRRWMNEEYASFFDEELLSQKEQSRMKKWQRRPHEFVQRAGDIVILPPQWAHSTISVGDCIAISRVGFNFARQQTRTNPEGLFRESPHIP